MARADAYIDDPAAPGTGRVVGGLLLPSGAYALDAVAFGQKPDLSYKALQLNAANGLIIAAPARIAYNDWSTLVGANTIKWFAGIECSAYHYITGQALSNVGDGFIIVQYAPDNTWTNVRMTQELFTYSAVSIYRNNATPATDAAFQCRFESKISAAYMRIGIYAITVQTFQQFTSWFSSQAW